MGNKGLQTAVAEGDTRTISLHHIHTGEDLTVTYMRDGRYDEEALKQVNHLLRDWRHDEEIRMDPRLLDVVWEVYRDVGASGPIQVVTLMKASIAAHLLISIPKGARNMPAIPMNIMIAIFGMRPISPLISSMSLLPIRCSTAPTQRNRSDFARAWKIMRRIATHIRL